jgi:hypothetical protein
MLDRKEWSDLQHAKDGDVVLAQHARRQHGGEVEEQVRLHLKLLRQRLFERRLKRVSRRRWDAVPSLRVPPVVVVDCRMQLILSQPDPLVST